MSKLILLIEDHEDQRIVVSRYLEFAGARVLYAADGETGVWMAAEYIPDLVLLDMRLPGLDGWAVMKRLQSHPDTSGIPVVALTGLDLPAEELEAAGFCGYLQKPLTPYNVLEEVERCLGRISDTEGYRLRSLLSDDR